MPDETLPPISDERAAALARRSVVRVSTLAEQRNEDDPDGTTVEERVSMMWQLALDNWEFMGEPVVEPRLPRHIDRIFRR